MMAFLLLPVRPAPVVEVLPDGDDFAMQSSNGLPLLRHLDYWHTEESHGATTAALQRMLEDHRLISIQSIDRVIE